MVCHLHLIAGQLYSFLLTSSFTSLHCLLQCLAVMTADANPSVHVLNKFRLSTWIYGFVFCIFSKFFILSLSIHFKSTSIPRGPTYTLKLGSLQFPRVRSTLKHFAHAVKRLPEISINCVLCELAGVSPPGSKGEKEERYSPLSGSRKKAVTLSKLILVSLLFLVCFNH